MKKPKVTLYGLKNCDTVQKAVKWLKAKNVNFELHDFKSVGIDRATLEIWMAQAAYTEILNKKSTTWRNTPADTQLNIIDEASAIEFLLNHTSAIKRPVLMLDNTLAAIGFIEEGYQQIFST